MKVQLQALEDFETNKWYEFTLESENRMFSIMVQTNGTDFVGFENFCPHQGRRLDYIQGQFLTDDNGQIICPAHGAEFESNSGLCIGGPCKGQSLKAVNIYVEQNVVWFEG